MIDEEILEVVRGVEDNGDRLNEIADEFRRGRDVNHLMVLLNSSNCQLVAIGTWILGELRFELYNSEVIVSRLRELIDHEDPTVRFHALGALYPALDAQDPATQTLLSKMRCDANEGVRRSAEAAAARLSLK